MAKTNWARLLLCGILTGVSWYLLSLVVFVYLLGGTAYAAAVESAHRPRLFPALPFILYLVAGIWAMWFYVSIRPRYGAGPKTAALTAVALWFVLALEGLRLAAVGFFPISLLGSAVASALPVILAASLVGAWAYRD
jgi:hypothetical protein